MPGISVIIATWNSHKVLPKCLESLTLQTYKDFEVIIVDNSSTDGTINDLQQKWPVLTIKVTKLEKNAGFAIANNIGAQLAEGKWLGLLNADAFPESTWLEKLLEATKNHPGFSSFSSRQIQANNPNYLDGAADAYHISGLAWRNGYKLPVNKYALEKKEVFSSCAAAALYSRDEFLKVKGFDEDYFSYFEDVDLGFRLRLGGAKCLYIPEAIVHHIGSASTGKRSVFSTYHGYRNMIWTFFKNMPSPLIWMFLPFHLSAILFFACYLTLRGQGKAIWRAIFDAVLGLPKILAKRKEVQRNIKINPFALLSVMSTGLFEPFQEFMRRNRGK